MLKPIHVLLVEDNAADADLSREMLERSKLKIELTVVADGVEALDFLQRRDVYQDAPRPDLILLDLKLPRKDGKAVLQEIKSHKELRRIPVVVLTSSRAEADIVQSYDLGANCYVIKPVDFKTFQHLVTAMESFWFTVVVLPPAD